MEICHEYPGDISSRKQNVELAFLFLRYYQNSLFVTSFFTFIAQRYFSMACRFTLIDIMVISSYLQTKSREFSLNIQLIVLLLFFYHFL